MARKVNSKTTNIPTASEVLMHPGPIMNRHNPADVVNGPTVLGHDPHFQGANARSMNTTSVKPQVPTPIDIKKSMGRGRKKMGNVRPQMPMPQAMGPQQPQLPSPMQVMSMRQV